MPQIILYINDIEDKIYTSDKISCYIISDTLPSTKIQEIKHLDKMILSQGDKALEICQKYNLDGIVKEIDSTKPLKPQLKPLRESLKKKTLGAIIPTRRHEAMLAGEVEPEFIVFKPSGLATDKEVISWYNEFFLIPCAWLASQQDTLKTLPDVDFVIVSAKNFENFGC